MARFVIPMPGLIASVAAFSNHRGFFDYPDNSGQQGESLRSIVGLTINPRLYSGRGCLLFFLPRAANFLRPLLVTAPIFEIVGDRCVTIMDPVRILRYGCRWFYCARFGGCRTVEHLCKSSRSFAVAHLVPR